MFCLLSLLHYDTNPAVFRGAAFRALDKDGTQSLSVAELKEAIHNLGILGEGILAGQLFHFLKHDHNDPTSEISRGEFMEKVKAAILPPPEENLLDDLASNHEEWAQTLARAKANKKAALEQSNSGFTRRTAHETFHLLVGRLKDDGNLIEKMFSRVDTDGGGEIDGRELHRALQDIGVELELLEIERIISLFDSDGNGTIDHNEFREVLLFAAQAKTGMNDTKPDDTTGLAEAIGAAAVSHLGAEWQ